MAVMAREEWTDERLDDLRADMNRRFDEMKGEVRDVKGEVCELRQEMNSRFDSMNGRFDARFGSLERTIVMGFVSMSATIVGALLVIQL